MLMLSVSLFGCSVDKSTAEEIVDRIGEIIQEAQIQEYMDTELDNMTLAMTAVMAANGIEEVVPQTTWTNSVMEFKCNSCAHPLSDMLQGPVMGFYYQWDSEGNVYQCKDTSCPDPF